MYLCLIPKWALNANVHICLSSEGLSEDGEETKDIEIDSKCNLQFKDVQKLTAQKEMITIIGKAMFPGDIAPNVSEIKGGTLRFQWYRDWETDRKSTRLNSSHSAKSRMPSSA